MKTSTPDEGPSPPDGPVVTGAAELDTLSREQSSSPPPSVPDYELLRRIGSGSYGDVWLARNVLGQCRAVKIIYRGRFPDPRPFEREFEGIQRFEPISRSHPSQLHILHVGKNDAAGCFYYVMELADAAEPRVNSESVISNQCSVGRPSASVGSNAPDSSEVKAPSLNTDLLITEYSPRTLRSNLERHGRLPIPDCVQIGLSLATALAHLHEQGLVHRDIKPSNIIFVNGVAKLGDIGLVTDAGDTQSIVGTEGYLPPEGPGTPQADLYSLGKVLYEISTGLDRRRFAALPEDSWTWPDRDQLMEFNEIVLRACAKDPAQRYQTGEQLRADLAWLQEGKSVRHAHGKQWLRARVKKVALGVALLALVVAGIILATVKMKNSGVPPEVAEGGPPSTNELANALCSKALMSLRADAHREFPEAYTNFHRAIEIDPHFAKPYVGLLELVLRENMPDVEFLPNENLRTITRRLVELAPDRAAAHCGQAILAFYDFDYPGAELHARRAAEVGPDYELGRSFYGYMLMIWGRTSEARRELEIARKLNPSKVQIYRCLAHSYYADRDFRRAIAMYREAVAWEPHDLVSYYYLGFAHRALGDFHGAIDAFEMGERIRTGETNRAESRFERLRQAFVRDGAPGYWEEAWKQTSTNQFFYRAGIQVRRGFTNDAFQLLERAYEARTLGDGIQDHDGVQNHLSALLLDEVWDPLHAEPRFQQLLDKLGFTKVNPEWRK